MKFTVEINPGDLAVNSAWRSGRGRNGKTTVRKSEKYANARSVVAEAALLAALEQGWANVDGPVSVKIRAYWGEREIDVDAPIKGVLDALEDAGVLANDAQVFLVKAEKRRSRDRPRIVITVRAERPRNP